MPTPARKLEHSQNFLRRSKLVESLVARSAIGSEDVVYEIGPGRGIITKALARRAKAVIAIEADQELFMRLKHDMREWNNVSIRHADFLTYRLPRNDYKVFANIPFNMSADIIRKLTDTDVPPSSAYLVVQEEAARKYAGEPFGRETLFSVLRKPWFVLEIVHRFSRWDFEPAPRVSPVLLHIKRRQKGLIDISERSPYQDFVAHGFTSFQPTVKKAFKNVFGHVEFMRLAETLGIALNARPTDLSGDQWREMYAYARRSRGASDLATRGALAQLHGHQQRLQKVHRTRTAPDWRRSIRRD